MYTITKRPIVILSAPRTGSTVLGEYIRKICKDRTIRYFDEPDNPVKNKMEDFLEHIEKTEKYIVKTHLYDIHRYSPHLVNFFTTSDSVFRIRIRRKSFVDQVASYYVAVARGKKWIFNKNKDKDCDFDTDTIDIDKNMLEQHIRYLYKCNQVLNNSQLNFDLDLYYEDLPAMNNVLFYVTPKPTNYQVLLDTAKETMSQMRDRNF